MSFRGNKLCQALSILVICGLAFPGMAEAATYKVKSGDCLWIIARYHHTTVSELRRLNGISGNLIRPGQVLRLDGGEAKAVAVASVSTRRTSSPAVTYRVKSGDCLWTISQRLGVSVSQLQRLNHLRGSRLYPGQVLRVSGAAPQPAAGRRAPNAPRPSQGRVLPGRSSVSSRGAEGVVATALRLQGYPYAPAGMSPAGFDCSGFVKYVFGRNGISLPRVANDQARAGQRINNISQLEPGDIVCFSWGRNGYIGHVGIYVGNGQFINASTSRGRITVSPFSDYYRRYFAWGVRVL